MEEITSQEATESSLTGGNEGDEDELFNQAVEMIKQKAKLLLVSYKGNYRLDIIELLELLI